MHKGSGSVNRMQDSLIMAEGTCGGRQRLD